MLRSSRPLFGIGRGIARIPQRRTSQAVRAGLRRNVNNSAARRSEFRGIGRCLDRELLYRFGSKADDLAGNTNSSVVHAIGEQDGAAGAAAIYAQIESWNGKPRGYSRILAACSSVHIRRGKRKIQHAAIHQWKVLHLSLGDGLSSGSALDVEKRRLFLDCYRRGDRSGTQIYVPFRNAGRVHLHFLYYSFREARRLDLDAILDRVEIVSRVSAGTRSL